MQRWETWFPECSAACRAMQCLAAARPFSHPQGIFTGLMFLLLGIFVAESTRSLTLQALSCMALYCMMRERIQVCRIC